MNGSNVLAITNDARHESHIIFSNDTERHNSSFESNSEEQKLANIGISNLVTKTRNLKMLLLIRKTLIVAAKIRLQIPRAVQLQLVRPFTKTRN